MTTDGKMIAYLEGLSRLRLTAQERESVDLAEILDYIDKLALLDTQGTPGISHPFPRAGAMREDRVVPSYDRQDILKNAPQQKDGYFQVPKTVE